MIAIALFDVPRVLYGAAHCFTPESPRVFNLAQLFACQKGSYLVMVPLAGICQDFQWLTDPGRYG